MNAYRLSGIQKWFGDRCALNIDDLTLASGKCHAIAGANGAGKTTLMAILALIMPPDKGSLSLFGTEVPAEEKKVAVLRRDVVMVDQHPVMFTQSVSKNITYGLKLRGVARQKRQQMAIDALSAVGLSHLIHKPAHSLSGGETQRVAMARALVLSPRILICDEPTSGVDTEHQQVVNDLITGLCRDHGTTVILSTHNPVQAEQLADNTMQLVEGRLVPWGAVNRCCGYAETSLAGTSSVRIGPMAPLLVKGLFSGRVTIGIDPACVAISGVSTEAVGTSTVMKGAVRQIAALGSVIRLTVDVGFPLSVDVGVTTYRLLSVQVGDIAWVSIPPDAVSVVPVI